RRILPVLQVHRAPDTIGVDPLLRRIWRSCDVPAAILVGELAIALDRDCLESQDTVLTSKRFSSAGDDLYLRRLTVYADDNNGQRQNRRDRLFHDQSPFCWSITIVHGPLFHRPSETDLTTDHGPFSIRADVLRKENTF